MATGSTLSVVRNKLKTELSESLSIGVANDAIYNQLLVNKQDWFLSEYNWGFLKDHWVVAMVQADRYRTLPSLDHLGATAAINWERPVTVETQLALLWSPVRAGIDVSLFNSINSELGLQADPIDRWQLKDGDPTSFEVWPIPASPQTLRFTGQRRPAAVNVASDSSTFVLDDMLLAYSVAGDILTERKKPSAQLKIALAQKRFATLRGNDPLTRKTFGLGSTELVRTPHFNPSAYRINNLP